MTDLDVIDNILAAVRSEVIEASQKHSPINSPHEGYAVILEELDELWDEVKPNRGRALSAVLEAIQVAAMGVRYIHDLAPHTYQHKPE